MKLLLTIVLIFISSICFAEEPISIKFIYLNGSNANTMKKKQDFKSGIFDVQKEIKKIFESNPCIYKTLLKDGLYNIDEKPEVFFWGFESEWDLKEVEKLLSNTKKKSPFLAQYFRSSIVRNIHDIIWVKRTCNMQNMINKLHACITDFAQDGSKIILLGHSAGAFITYVYTLNKIQDFDTKLFVPEKENKKTCSDAILASGIGIRLYDGELIKNPDSRKIIKGYNEIDSFTNKECVPNNLILGVMNFGSPLPLFYPDRLNEPKNNSYIYQKNLLEFIQSHGLFFLTLNYADDTLSLLAKYDLPQKEEKSGFIYTYMEEKSPSSFIKAHYTYWKYPKHFAKMAKNGYLEATR